MAQQRIRWGILGTGNIAGEFAEGLAVLPDAQLFAVGSRTQASADRFATKYNIPNAHSSYQDLVQNPDVDVIYIASPHVTHKEHCLLCLDAGKAVLCEKPFTLNAAEAAEVIALAREKNLFCMEAMWMRFLPAVREARRLVAANAIGDIRLIQGNLGFLMNYDPTHRTFNPALGGGALLDLGIYPLSLIVHFLGLPDTVTSQAHIGETGVDEQSAVILGYAGGQLGILHTSMRTYSANDATIMGSTGQIHLHGPIFRPERLSVQKHTIVIGADNGEETKSNNLRATLRQVEPLRKVYRKIRPVVASILGQSEKSINLPTKGNGYEYEATEVMACLRAGKTESDIMPLDETLKIMELMDSIRAQWGLRYPQEETGS